MANYVRKNAFDNGGDFNNSDLRWYAKGVQQMMNRALDDPASWWFFAAMHGEYVNPNTDWYVDPPAFPDWGFIDASPKVPTSPLPDQATQDLYWNQCQHGSFYFLPWHRGYLMALEAQLRADIVALGGPADWALPYWDYFGGQDGGQAAMPPAFGEPTLDGKPNPLYVARRYGPDGDRNVYIPTTAWEASHPESPAPQDGDVTNECLGNDLYTGSDQRTTPPGFGGPTTTFSHSGRAHGNMESNPHDLVHVYSGGSISDSDYGLMADPGTAALDPIFYLHHCNIDRMWAIWNASGNSNPSDQAWLNGPTPRSFVMPWPNAKPWTYSPKEVANLSDLNYGYAELGAVAADMHPVARRLARLGAKDAAARVQQQGLAKTPSKPAELLGASAAAIPVQGTGARAVPVKLDAGVRSKVANSFAAITATALPDRTYLKLEDVRGTNDATVLGVYVNLADNASKEQRRASLAGQVALFGLRRASAADGEHGGGGLTFVLDVTRVVDGLAMKKALDVDSLQVSLLPRRKLPDGVKITVGRISIYREGQ